MSSVFWVICPLVPLSNSGLMGVSRMSSSTCRNAGFSVACAYWRMIRRMAVLYSPPLTPYMLI